MESDDHGELGAGAREFEHGHAAEAEVDRAESRRVDVRFGGEAIQTGASALAQLRAVGAQLPHELLRAVERRLRRAEQVDRERDVSEFGEQPSARQDVLGDAGALVRDEHPRHPTAARPPELSAT